jgi:putative N6-adenine-specific DNA methylase
MSDPASIYEFHASVIPGLESVLCDELRDLGFKSVRLNRGGIPFRGTMQDGWRACLESRIAQRIQLLMGRFPCRSQAELYQGVHAIDWSPYVSSDQTISVSAVSRESALSHSGFVAQKTKDAIVDQIREKSGERPSVDREDADVRVFVHVANEKASVYLDMAGDPLHKRGYRSKPGEAPLRETLAAGLIRLVGWDQETTFVDPVCGSGTLAIEAALWANHIAPGLLRSQFGFERWACFDEDHARTLRDLTGTLRQSRATRAHRIVASDVDPQAVEAAKHNARAAGVKLAFRNHDVLQTPPSGNKGVILTNPPYGVRLEMASDFPKQLARVFTRLHGWRIGILAGAPEYKKAIAVSPTREISIKNGALDCSFLIYDMP